MAGIDLNGSGGRRLKLQPFTPVRLKPRDPGCGALQMMDATKVLTGINELVESFYRVCMLRNCISITVWIIEQIVVCHTCNTAIGSAVLSCYFRFPLDILLVLVFIGYARQLLLMINTRY